MDWPVTRRIRGAMILGLITFVTPSLGFAQDEDIEPRIVGAKGLMAVGVSGFVDTFASTEDTFPFQLTIHADVRRFVTSWLALRGGVIGSSAFGEDNESERTGPGAAALHLQIGSDVYFTPASMASFYVGGEYRAQLTRRADKDAGSMLGIAGVQAALSSRASVFVQGGYGMRLTRGAEGEIQTRLTGEVGLRFRF
jgi:hypothetical protein